MTDLILDTGALIALDRDDRSTWAMLRNAADDGVDVVVPAGAVAQAWRDGARQARLGRAVVHCEDVPIDGSAARAAGLLCGRAGTSDVVDASIAVVAIARARQRRVAVLTSDPNDLEHLLSESASPVPVVQV